MSIDISQTAALSNQVIAEVERAVVGKRPALEMIMTAVLAGGHVLLEDYPGLVKSLVARSFATALGLEFKRIQFTPDLLPGDITGGYVFNRAESRFELRPGPIFANIILADEINRASPKTQSALLEAMQEAQVTLEGESMSLPRPFLVLATQNPIEYEGTFPLPEAQLDRFMIKLSVGYPDLEEEREILMRRHQRRQEEVELTRITDPATLLEMCQAVESVHIDPDLVGYIAQIVQATRADRRAAVGASPRGSLAFLRMARAYAAMQGRDFVLPDDIKHFARPVLSHRIVLQPEFWLTSQIADKVVDEIIARVRVPVLKSA
jgi:MoxR-like ATPase